MNERLKCPAAAAYLGLSSSALDKMRHEGRGPRYLKIGGRVFYRQADLDDYISASVVETVDSRASLGAGNPQITITANTKRIDLDELEGRARTRPHKGLEDPRPRYRKGGDVTK